MTTTKNRNKVNPIDAKTFIISIEDGRLCHVNLSIDDVMDLIHSLTVEEKTPRVCTSLGCASTDFWGTGYSGSLCKLCNGVDKSIRKKIAKQLHTAAGYVQILRRGAGFNGWWLQEYHKYWKVLRPDVRRDWKRGGRAMVVSTKTFATALAAMGTLKDVRGDLDDS